MSRWKEYYRDPFGFYDELSLKIGRYELNLFKDHASLRQTITLFVWVTALVWAVMGFDSGTGMLEWPIMKFLTGHVHSWADAVYWYNWAYGKTMHWSAFVIYGLLFTGISRILEDNLGMTNTRNTAYSFSFTLFNMACFEYFWIYSFAYFQNQPWVAAWRWPQLRILVQNFGLFFVGLLAMVYFWLDSYRLDWTGKVTGRLYKFKPGPGLILVVLMTAFGVGLWYYYPGHVGRVVVDIEGFGPWINNVQFPQTLYTVDVDVTDNVNAGDWFYVEDNLIHLLNTGVKLLFADVSLMWVNSWRKEEK